jgi:Protein of unknown function (DUF2934)
MSTNVHGIDSRKEKKAADPVLPDQSGRLTALDPLGTNAAQHVLVRQKAYEIYVRRGRVDGHALDHWLEAEGQVQDPK